MSDIKSAGNNETIVAEVCDYFQFLPRTFLTRTNFLSQSTLLRRGKNLPHTSNIKQWGRIPAKRMHLHDSPRLPVSLTSAPITLPRKCSPCPTFFSTPLNLNRWSFKLLRGLFVRPEDPCLPAWCRPKFSSPDSGPFLFLDLRSCECNNAARNVLHQVCPTLQSEKLPLIPPRRPSTWLGFKSRWNIRTAVLQIRHHRRE